MSSFSENFQRDDNKETQVDDSAFYTFAIGMLLVGIVTFLILIIRRLLYDKKYNSKTMKNCQCSHCKERLNKYYSKIRAENINFTFFLYIAIVIALVYLSYLSYLQVDQTAGKLKGFDPYDILEIDPSSDEKTIKKAYKKLALKYHPDKNPNNLQAKAKFILIAKAYDALTNEESKKNYEKYGNPDGPGPMRVSVALPSFVLNKKNHMPILILFVIFILVILPSGFMFWYKTSSKYNDTGMMMNDTYIFYQYLNENILLKQMPFVMGLAMEYNGMQIRPDEAELLFKMYKKNLDLMCKHPMEKIPPSNKKAICLLYSYLNNTPMNYEHYQADLDFVLRPTRIFIENMYKMCIEFTQLQNLSKLDRRAPKMKTFGYSCIKTIFEFSQNLHQKNSHVKNILSPFTQLPYFTEEKIKVMSRNYRKIFNNKPTVFSEFLAMDKAERDAILDKEFGSDQIIEINEAINALPQYEAKIDVFVEGFEDILINDLVTFKLTIVRKNLEEGMTLGVNHSNYYPEIFNEQVSMCIVMDKNIVYQSVIDINKRETTHEYRNPVKDIGTFKFTCELCPLNYKGLDIVIPFEVNVVKASEGRKEHLKQIAKREIKKIEPSYFQQMLNQVIPYQGDDDDEEEDEEEDKKEEEKKEEEKKEEDSEHPHHE